MNDDTPYSKLVDLFAGDWWRYAFCNDAPEEFFFDERFEEQGKSMCADCPVRIECLDDALIHDDEGIRGGLNEEQRISLTLHRKRHALAFRFDVLNESEMPVLQDLCGEG